MPKASIDSRTSAATGELTYRVRWRENGKQPQESFADMDSAIIFQGWVERMGGAAARKLLRSRQREDNGMPTLREYTEKYLDEASGLLTGITDGTREGYKRNAARSFLVVLGEYPLDTIQRSDVGQWIAWQEKQPSLRKTGELISAKTIKNYQAQLSSVLKSAVDQKILSENVAYRTRIGSTVRREPVFLSPEEFATLLHFIPDYYKPLVRFLAHTGTRWGEATALTWGDVDRNGRPPSARITKAWKKGPTGAPVLGTPKSRKARRTVSLDAEVIRTIGEPGRSDRLVFQGKLSGGHIWYQRFRVTTWNRAVAKAQDRALCLKEGFKPLPRAPRIHDLRHSHASWLIAAGVPLPYIQARLGHEKITTTVDVYGHLVPDAHEVMAAAIAEVLTPKPMPNHIGEISAFSDTSILEGELVE